MAHVVPDHPAIAKETAYLVRYGREHLAATVTCPGCQAARLFPLAQVRAQFNKGNFTGRCKACRKRKPKEAHMIGRVRLPDGYIAIRRFNIASEDLPLFERMADAERGQVLEHVWLMSKLLGRPVAKWELVKHRNQRRDDNRIENLELILNVGEKRTVLRELTRAREILKLYSAVEPALRAAAEPAGEPAGTTPAPGTTNAIVELSTTSTTVALHCKTCGSNALDANGSCHWCDGRAGAQP